MANNKENKKGKGLAALLLLIKDAKNLPLIASLLGGTAVITTGTILLAPNLSSSSSVSSLPTSSEPISSSLPSSSSITSSSESLVNWTVTFDAKGGDAVNSVTVQAGQLLTEPTTHYGLMELSGWYQSTDGGQTIDAMWNFATNQVTSDLTLYANWEVPLLTDYDRLTGGDSSLLVIDDNQLLWGWGENSNGNLGIGSIEDRTFPTRVSTDFLNENETMLHISTTYSHSILLTSENRLFGFGSNRDWTLGLDVEVYNTVLSPMLLTVPLETNETILNAWAGEYTTWILTSEGRLLVTGENYDGETGLPNDQSNYVEGFTEVPFTAFADDEIIVDFFVYDYAYYALTNLGNIFSWGFENDGRLGINNIEEETVRIPTLVTFPDLLPNEYVIDISLYSSTVVALTNQNRVYGIGATDDGELAPPEFDLDPYFTPQLINLGFLEANDKVIAVEAGNDHTVFYTESGKFYQVGDNGDGQLGTGNNQDSIVPLLLDLSILADDESIVEFVVGNDITVFRTNQNRWYGIGDNTSNLISFLDIEEVFALREIERVGLNDNEIFTQLALGQNHSLGLTSTGRLFSWGINVSGQLGQPATVPNSIIPQQVDLSLNNGETITKIYARGNTSFVLTSEGRLFGWGQNENGELGLGTTDNQFGPLLLAFSQLNVGETITSFFLDYGNKFIITSTNRLLGWGQDGYALGLGNIVGGVATPTVIPFPDLVGAETIQNLFIGNSTRFALSSTGRVFAWGYSWLGSLGLGLVEDYIYTPTLMTFAGLNAGEQIISIAGNNFNAMAITNNNRIFGWGDNRSNIFAVADGSQIDSIGAPVLLDIEGIVDNTIRTIYGNGNGVYYFFTTNEEIYTTGNNGNGQLGNGTTDTNYGSLILLNSLNLAPSDSLVMATFDGFSIMLLTEEGRIFVWGVNDWGKLLTLSSQSSQYNSPLEVNF